MLSQVLAWLEDFGTPIAATQAIALTLTQEERQVLTKADVLRPAPDAKSLPCDERADCAREIRANAPGAKLPFVAVCTREPYECAARDVGREEIARTEIVLGSLLVALGAACGVQSPRVEFRAADDAIRLGRMGDDAACELFFWRCPDAALDAFLATRDRSAAATRVLVPTSRRLSKAVAARGDVIALDEALVVERGVLAVRGVARAPHLRIVKREKETASTLPAITTWNDAAFAMIDNHTVRIRVGNVAARRTYHDFGMANDKNRQPIKAWVLFIAFLENRGVYKGKGMGSVDVVTRLVSTLRAELKRAFAIDENPIADYAGKVGWVARFRVEEIENEES